MARSFEYDRGRQINKAPYNNKGKRKSACRTQKDKQGNTSVYGWFVNKYGLTSVNVFQTQYTKEVAKNAQGQVYISVFAVVKNVSTGQETKYSALMNTSTKTVSIRDAKIVLSPHKNWAGKVSR